MRCSGGLLAAVAVIPKAICTASLSPTSWVTCMTTLGTSSVVPVPTTSNLRSLTVNSLQPSTLTPTATSTPPDETTTLTYTEFPTTTTTLANTEIDTFSTTTTFVSALLITNTVITTITSTASQTITSTPTSTIPTIAGFLPSASAQAMDLPQYGSTAYPNKKRSFGYSPIEGSYGGAIGARQWSAAATSSSSPPGYTHPNAMSCTGTVEYFSVTTKIVATAPVVTTTLVPITDTTSMTDTTTITSSVLSTPASTTETLSTTITTSSLAAIVTSTVSQTSTTTITVQAAQVTTYGACQANNLITTVKDANYPINYLYNYGLYLIDGLASVTTAASAYDCCVQGVTTYEATAGGTAYNPATGQCYINHEKGWGYPTLRTADYSYCPKVSSSRYTLSALQYIISDSNSGAWAVAPQCQ